MGESPLIKYMVARCATHFPVAYEATPVPWQGFEIAPLIHSGNQATKDRGMMRGQFPGAGFSGTSTRLQCSTHQSSAVGWCARASDFLGKSWGILELAANPGREFRENLGFLHHRAASFAGAPITPRERRHVTQPRARINVSCSRADHK